MLAGRKGSGLQQQINGITGIAALHRFLGKLLTDLHLVIIVTQHTPQGAVEIGFETIALTFLVKFIETDSFKNCLGTITEKSGHLEQVLPGTTVDHGIGAAGIIPHHSSHHGSVGRAGLGTKEESMGFEEHVEFIADHAWLHPYPMFFFIEFNYLGKVFRYIHNDPVAHYLSGQGGPGGTGDQGGLLVPCKSDQFSDIGLAFGNGHGQGHFAVSGCISGIQGTHGYIIIQNTFQLRS